MDNLGAVVAIKDRARDEKICARAAADEAFVRVDAVTAVDLDCLAVRRQPVVCPGSGNHQVVGRDLSQCGRRFRITPNMLEYVHAYRVAVHRVREPGRAAVASEFANDGADLRVARATAAEFQGNPGGEQPAIPEVGIVSCDEFAVPVVHRRTGCKGITGIACNAAPVRGLVSYTDSFQCHDFLPK